MERGFRNVIWERALNVLLEIAERTVAAVRFSTGRAEERDELRRREMRVVVNCILTVEGCDSQEALC